MKWEFEETDETRSNVSGDVAKLVRNYSYSNPGVLSIDHPSDGATLLAREAIQNSWDSALERQEDDNTCPAFELVFRYKTLYDSSKSDFIKSAGLDDLANRAQQLSEDTTTIVDQTVLEDINDPSLPLNIMYLEETGTTGMYGPFKGKQSKMSLAMVSVGFTRNKPGLGGSYGQGKAGLIRASGTRIVFGYSAFAKANQDRATRRLLGMTYWSSHSLEGTDFNGWARFAESGRPYEDQSADDLATHLNIRTRDATDPVDLGSTFLIIDPTVKPTELIKAVERYWWPALESPKFEFKVTVIDYKGEELIPRPRRDEALREFIRAYGLATSHAHREDETSKRSFLSKIDLPSQKTISSPGVIALVSDVEIDGWTWPSQEDTLEHKNLVALIRKPRMIVKYLDAGGGAPFIRGVFVASLESNDLLAATEPPLHDDWPTNQIADEIPEDAYALSSDIISRIKNQVGALRRKLRPPSSSLSRVALREFDKYMKNLLSGKSGQRKRPVDPGVSRYVSFSFLELGPELAPNDAAQVRSRARIRFTPMERVLGEAPFHVMVQIEYRLLEDNTLGEPWEITADDYPDDFSLYTDEIGKVTLTGNLDKNGIEVSVLSDSHNPDWSGVFLPTTMRLDDSGEEYSA